MDKAQLLEIISNIGTCEDEVQRRELLTSLSDEVGNVFDDNQTLRDQNNKFKEDNDRLIESNRKYFLRLETQKTEQEVQRDSTGIKTPDEHKRSFEDLFNEEGGLK